MNLITESLQKKKKQLEETLTSKPAQNSSLVEVALMSLYNLLANRYATEADNLRESGALVAIGQFGRRIIGVHSPIEVLLLIAPDSEKWLNEWVEGVFYPLRDAGWELFTQAESLDEVLKKADREHNFFQSLLFSRFVSGNRSLFNQFKQALGELISRKREDFIPALRTTFDERRVKCLNEQHWLEPDLFYTPGAIQDILDVQSAAYVGFKAFSIEDAIFQGLLSRHEADKLIAAMDFYMNVLNILQVLKKRYIRELSFVDQIEVAEKMGYEGSGNFKAVEVFMRDVHRHLYNVKNVASLFWSRLEELEEARQDSELLTKKGVGLATGLRELNGKIYVSPSRYEPSEANILSLFSLASEQNLALSTQVVQWIVHHLNTISISSCYEDDVRSAFWNCLATDDTEATNVRSLYSLGIMQALVPELETVHALVEHDAFHVYPVHEHHLLAYQEVKKLLNGVYTDTEPELTDIARRIVDHRILYFAALMHDLGKGFGAEHADVGAKMVRPIGERFGLNSEELDLLQFLVRRHVFLVESASMRDLSDEEMLRRACEEIKTVERLDQLLVLSFAVMKSLGSHALEQWKSTPVLRLSHLIRYRLEKGEPDETAMSERLARFKEEVLQQLEGMFSEEELEKHFELVEPRYLVSVSPQGMAQHLRLEKLLNGEQLAWQVEDLGGGEARLTIVTRESAAFLPKAAGALTLHDLDIREAQIFSKRNGVLLVVFYLKYPVKGREFKEWNKLHKDLLKIVKGRIAIDYRIAAKALSSSLERESQLLRPSKVLVDNESSEKYTIIEVYSDDRPGLLYTITRTLVDMQLKIFVAKISTQLDQAVDVFYVKTLDGAKMMEREQLEEIKKALLFWLDKSDNGREG